MLRPLGRSVQRRVMRLLNSSPVAVLEWGGWDKFLIQRLCPDALRIRVRPGDRAQPLLAALPLSTRIVIVHIDLTMATVLIPDIEVLARQLRERGTCVLNGTGSDTGKGALQQWITGHGLPGIRAPRDGPADERLIVKTMLNAGGAPERRLLAQIQDPHLTPPSLETLISTARGDSLGYQVCRRRDISDQVWDDPTLTVERFIENEEGVYFRVYSLGHTASVVEAWSDYEIKKLVLPVRRRVDHFFSFEGADAPRLVGATLNGVPCGDLPSERAARAAVIARTAAKALGADFHATDCVVDDTGRITPVDVNKTPYWGDDIRPGVLEHLRLGLDRFLGG